MANNSVVKRLIGTLRYSDEVVVDCGLDGLSNYLDKRTGGQVSGDVGIVQHNLNILSGNYIQTSTPDAVVNYASKNTFLHADVDPKYG